MTIAVDLGRKATKQTNKQTYSLYMPVTFYSLQSSSCRFRRSVTVAVIRRHIGSCCWSICMEKVLMSGLPVCFKSRH